VCSSDLIPAGVIPPCIAPAGGYFPSYVMNIRNKVPGRRKKSAGRYVPGNIMRRWGVLPGGWVEVQGHTATGDRRRRITGESYGMGTAGIIPEIL
jgi:hypothetical protein